MKQPLIVANWKMNGSELLLRDLVRAFERQGPDLAAQVVLTLPAPFFSLARALLESGEISWGGQNIHWQDEGAFTGEISAPMIAAMGGTHCIVGHSERRQGWAETDQVVASKAQACLRADITPIVCVGERLEERQQDKTMEVVKRQLEAVITNLAPALLEKIVVAYEPVWAIGTGQEAKPEMAQEVHSSLKKLLDTQCLQSPPVLYGGSVKADNVAALLAMDDVDGVLVGGASLVTEEFVRLCAYAGEQAKNNSNG